MPNLCVLICTHNRADLLERVLASLNAAQRPSMPVHVLVAANACTDDTVERLRAYQAQQAKNSWLPLQLIEVPTPGKSHALNQAIPMASAELIALVDDDHRVDADYLSAIEQAANVWPDAGLYCGRIIPDWDGSEPAWVHDDGPYRIYPLPVPRYDQGGVTRMVTADHGPIPGGGNLVVRRKVFELAGEFSTTLGPQGHDLGGGEDSEYVLRALARGATCRYVPEILQYHYVDTERLQLGYLLRKGYQRTRSTSRIQGNGRVPLYMWRKVAEYSFHTVFSLSWARRRFYLVRMAAALGEVKGRAESGHRGHGLDLPPDRGILGTWVLGIFALVSGLMAWFFSGENLDAALFPVVGVAGVGSAALLTKSLLDFSQTGPRIREEILTHYRRYTLYALARLAFWAFVLMAFSAGGGVLAYYALNVALAGIWSPWLATVAATLGVLGATGVQFIRMLRHNPGLLVASMHYRMSRLYPLWQLASVRRIRIFLLTLTMAAATLMLAASWRLAAQAHTQELAALWCALLAYVSLTAWTVWVPKAQPVRNKISVTNARPTNGRPNILLIGSDTLRADRLGALGYHRAITPNIDALSTQGILFENCYVPCARTAPSLVSLLTGTWPHTHGIRDNFVADAETQLTVDALPTLLKPLGYRSAAISDWCGADMGKLSFGFDYTDLPEDQWNIKYLIRQGPKDLRLFISLFVHNRLGRLLLPELYYLGGVPLTSQLGSRARRLVSRLAASEQPFFLDVFYSTTHPPFASEWPWYTRFSDPAYAGESKFAMAKLTDPFEIIRRQGQPKEEFDLDQIINLYDGSVAQFDEEVGKMLRHLDESGLANNTIVVVYSDHGMEFFEHDTWGQGNSAVGDFSPRVPLLIRDPRRPAIGKVHEVVRSIDLAPTLMELIGSVPNQHMEGVSLVTCYDKAGGCPQLTAFSETGIWIADIPGMPENHLRYPGLLELLEVTDTESGTLGLRQEYKTAILRAKDRMLRDGKWKLVYQPLEKGHLLRLFDLESDPNCMHNTLDRNQEMRAQLWNRLSTWIKRDEEICNRDLKKP